MYDIGYGVVSCCFFFFKQKTAYEMRISDWSSDVCSSDLTAKYLAKFGETKTRARLGKAGADYLDQVDGLLDRFDFRKISDKAADRRSSLATWIEEIGRASCRERVCQYV